MRREFLAATFEASIVKKLPKHLEIIESGGQVIFGQGPFSVYIRNKTTNKVARLKLPDMKPTLTMTSPEVIARYFMREFEAALKEQLNENLEY